VKGEASKVLNISLRFTVNGLPFFYFLAVNRKLSTGNIFSQH